MPSVHLKVHGRVQGVGFRWFVRETARRSELAGWVRNLDDGRVEVMAVGSDDGIGRLVAAVHLGPAGARVDHVEVMPLSDESAASLPSPFVMLRKAGTPP